jgi:hypothetical protein
MPFSVNTFDKSAGKKTGFIVGYDSGHIRVYFKNDSITVPYKRAEPDLDDL